MIRIGDTVWVVANIGAIKHIIGKGTVKAMHEARMHMVGVEPVLCTVHLTELYRSTNNSRVVGVSQVFKDRDAAERYLFLWNLKR